MQLTNQNCLELIWLLVFTCLNL